jgi:hypothetical protein
MHQRVTSWMADLKKWLPRSSFEREALVTQSPRGKRWKHSISRKRMSETSVLFLKPL